MSQLSKQALLVGNQTSFPNNNTNYITPVILRDFNIDVIDSTVNQTQYNTNSGSWNVSIANINEFTASASGLTTGSLLITASAAGNVITFTKGNNTTFNVTVATGSIPDISNLNQATASLQAYTASANVKFSNLETTTASLNTSVSNINTFTASTAISLTNLNASSASQQISIDNLNQKTGSYATTGSNTFVSANTFTSISASSFVSASQFVGDGSKLTGLTSSISMPILDEGVPQGNAVSLNFTGSGVGASVVGGVAIISVYSVDSASYNAFTASMYQFTSSVNSTTASQQVSINNLNLYTSSFNTASLVSTASFNSYTSSNNQRVSSLEVNSASVNISVSALNTYTASQSTASLVTSITNLNTFSASALVSISNLNASSASQQISINALNTNSASVNTSITNINSATASLFSSASLALVTASFDNGTRNLTFTKGNTTQFSVNIPDVSGSAAATTTIYDTVYTGESITKGDPLYISGSQGANPIVFKADAAVAAKMPVTYVSNETIGAGTTTEAIILGHIEGIDLTGYVAGQSIYVAEGGGWSTSLPSGSNSITQLLGVVTKGGSGGKGLVLNPGPAQLPGLDTGKMWVGNGSNQPIEITTASFASSASFNSYTSSINLYTASMNAYTSSNDTKWTTLGLLTGSYITANQTSSFATTGSNIFNGTQSILSNLYVSSSNTADVVIEGQMMISSSTSGSANAARLDVSGAAQLFGGSRTARVFVRPQDIQLVRGGYNTTIAANSYTLSASSSIGYFGVNSTTEAQAYVAAQNPSTLALTQITLTATPTLGALKDWDDLAGTPSTFMQIGYNDGVSAPPIPQFTRGLSISGSGGLQVTGSAYGNVVSMSITSNTASMDLSKGNYFELTSSTTPVHINLTNLKGGLTSTLIVSASASSSILFSPNVAQPSGSAYSGSAGSIDVLSFVAFNSSKANVVATKALV